MKSMIGRIVLSIALAGAMFGDSRARAASPARLSTGQRATRVYALVELSQQPTSVSFHQRLGTSGVASATGDAIRQLDVVNAQQKAFQRAVTNAKLSDLTEIYRLQRVYNGILYRTSPSNLAALKALPGVRAVHLVTPKQLDNAYSMPFVGVPQLWTNLGLPLHGESIKVGVIDTGIDYTHANFGGPGTPTDYTNNDPAIVEAGSFPTAKVVGGYDFAGFDYDASDDATSTPVPDADPLDGAEHGSHVAGTVAGYGVRSDGTRYTGPYDQSIDPATMNIGPGAAPLADLYALKVFGDVGGSTSLASQAVEWAVDPDGDGDFSDHLDVVNLSLGSSYGGSGEEDAAIYRNAVQAGVVIVASAGNSSDIYFITGSPASTPEVISVAASQSDRVPYAGLQINAPTAIAGAKMAGTAAFGPTATPAITGDVVASAPTNGCTALTNAAAIAGKIALVARGTCTFKTKTLNAQNAGAIAVIITNDRVGPPVGMGDDPSITTPITVTAQMLSQDDGNAVRAELAVPNVVNATLDGSLLFLDTTNPDSIASFSSRGPSRLGNQALLKPDISAPGVNIISTAMGTGSDGVSFSGTSMSSPLVAGIMVLLRQAHPTWTPADLKALAMNTASHNVYASNVAPRPLLGPGRDGAGRVDAFAALSSNVIAYDAAAPGRVSVSFAATDVAQAMTEVHTVRLRNTGTTALTFDATVSAVTVAPGTRVTLASPSVVVPASGSADIDVTLTADPATMTRAREATVAATRSGVPRYWQSETSGFLVFAPQGGGATLRVPFFAALSPASQMDSTGPLTTTGPTGTASLTLTGSGIDTTAIAPAPLGALSLVMPLELMHASPRGAPVGGDLPTGYDPANVDNANLQYVGVTSNFPDMAAVADSEIYFGLTTYGMWGAPGEVEFDIFIKKSSAPDWQFAIFNGDFGTSQTTPGNDLLLTMLVDLVAGTPPAPEDFLNGLAQSDYFVPVFLSNAMVLPVYAADLGLTDTDGAIDFQVVSFSRSFAFPIDVSPVLHYDLTRPSLSTIQDANLGLGAFYPPVWTDKDAETIDVTYDLDRAATTQVGGVLLLHMLNAFGARADVVQVSGLSCTTNADCTSPSARICDPASGICMGCLTNTDCRGGELCDTAGTRTCLSNQCQDPVANPCPSGNYCDTTGACVADCRFQGAISCAPHTWCSTQSGLCNPAIALVNTIPEDPGPNCGAGGVRIDSGLDDNNDGVLDTAEVLNASFVCRTASQLVVAVDEPAGTNCAEGGQAIQFGADTNGDGILDPAEVTNISYVCNRADGFNTLVRTSTAAPDATCPTGGTLIESGVDADRSGTLDASEVASATTVCNGLDSLVAVSEENPGTNCPGGGQRIDAGVDANGDGTLQTGEVQTTSYVCSGLNGATGPAGEAGAKGEGCGCSGLGGGSPSLFLGLLGLIARRRRAAQRG